MRTLKIMSVISILLNILMFYTLVSAESVLETVITSSAVLVLLFLWGIIFSIVALVQSTKNKVENKYIATDYNEELLKLFDLKEKGILTQEEFDLKKEQILYVLRTDIRNFNKAMAK